MVHTSLLKRLLPSIPPQFTGLNLEDLILFHSLPSHISMTQSFNLVTGEDEGSIQVSHGHMVSTPTAYSGGPWPRDQLS